MKKYFASISILFIAAILLSAIVYSRGISARQLPFVHIAFHTSDSFFWEYNANVLLEEASDEFRDRGNWMLHITLPRAVFADYLDEMPSIIANTTSENFGAPEPAEVVLVQPINDDYYLITLAYTSPVRTARFRAGRIHGQETWVGERHSVNIRSAVPADMSNLLPETAVHYDADTGRHYILSVSREDGIFGRRHIAMRHYVEIERSLRGMASLVDMPTTSPIIVQSGQPIHGGTAVRIFD